MSKEEANEALLSAAEEGDVEALKAALAAGADVNAANDEDKTALYLAAEKGFADCVNALLEGGADVEAPDDLGFTPLYISALTCHDECINLLIAAGADVNFRDDLGRSVLTAACKNPESVKLLLEAGADVNTKDFDGYTPLTVAAMVGCQESIDLLKAAGAEGDVDILQFEGEEEDDVEDSEVDIDEMVAKAISEFASARKLGEDMVRAILAYKGCDTDCSSATFEGWKHYDDIEDIIDEQFDVDDEIDNIISEYEEEGEEAPDEDEIRAITYDRLEGDLMFNFDVIELCDYLEDGDGYLVKPQ